MNLDFIDMHCDTLTESLVRGDGTIYEGPFMQSISHMKNAGQMAQFFAVFFTPRERIWHNLSDEEFWETVTANFHAETAKYPEIIREAQSAAQIRTNYAEGKVSAVLTIEDGRIVNGNMERLVKLRSEGVCAMSLTWNYTNCFGTPNSDDPAVMNEGLTDFGKEAVRVMNDIGIMVDVSHLSDGGFWDVAAISRRPFIATHSNCRAISPHRRNLTDEMIRALAESGGVAGINFCPDFVNPDMDPSKMRAEGLARHILHMIDVGGEDTPALGTDFDGIEGELEIGHPEEMYLLFDELKRRGVTKRQIDKLKHENVLRVMEACLG